MEFLFDELEVLHDDGVFALYRVRQHGTPVFARVAVSSQPAAGTVRRLEYEYSLASELDPGWAALPLALGSYRGFATLTLQDNGAQPLLRILGQPLEPTRAVGLAINMAAALGRVHRRGLIHKDIKPANILVGPACSVRFTGFGIASRLPRERQAPAPPEIIAGTLAYMSPEQTGRMNRSIDTRSDLYSLGVTLYEMLTGELPFTAPDPVGWVHSHMARLPVPPIERIATIPHQLSAIVLKLLAKTGEDRYQSASGLEADLRRCLIEFDSCGQIQPFRLGTREVSHRLVIPERLYGREREVTTLLAAFGRVASSGKTEFALLSGYSGVGKSSVVSELHKALVASQSLFASGKFEELKRHIPYGTLAKAFLTLVRQILAKREAELDQWRRDLSEALGANAQLIANLIPELELVIGKQPPIGDLTPRDEQDRFQVIFRRFLGVFARSNRPLALFLDDLQWADSATLELIVHLVTHDEVRHLLLVGAYRENEVGQSHPLMQALRAIENARFQIEHIALAPLGRDDVGRLTADSLRCNRKDAQPLAQLIHEKTDGNPFFVIQFLTALAEDGLLALEPGAEAWSWDLSRIRAKGFTANVADLLAAKLGRMPDGTKQALGQLACLGNVAEDAALALVIGVSEEELHAALWEAARSGLVFHADGTYLFVHDRVQEAAYALVASEDRAKVHVSIGRLLASRVASSQFEESIFEIVNQFDRGLDLVVTEDERRWVAELNLMAGRRAKAATAYIPALAFLRTGHGLLPNDRWVRCGRLAFAFELAWAECDYLAGNLTDSEARLTALSRHADTTTDGAAITCLRANVYTNSDRLEQAIEVGLEFLRNVGIEWALPVTAEEVAREYECLFGQLKPGCVEALVNLPPMTDPGGRATMDVLVALIRAALFTDENLMRLVIGRMANLSLEHGNHDGSCLAYVWLGVVLAGHFGDPQAGFRVGSAGLDLIEKRGLSRGRYKSAPHLDFGNRIAPWTRHLRMCRSWLQTSFKAAQDAGEAFHAAYSRSALITHMLASGEPLADVQREAETWFEFARRSRADLTKELLSVQLSFIAELRGGTPDPGKSEELEGSPRPPIVMCSHWIRTLQSRFHTGDIDAADEAATKTEPLLWTLPSHVELADYQFYAALTRAARWDRLTAEGRRSLAGHHAQLQSWAKSCPENFGSQASLISAEVARIGGRELEAMSLYEEAIRLARQHGFVQNEGVASELAARFHASRGIPTIADAYIGNARNCYLRWGAKAKLRQLDECYPHLRSLPPTSAATASLEADIEELDVRTMLKASQALSGEIVLGSLIETLMRIAVEHAGAERGVLVLFRNEEAQVAAEAVTGRGPVVVTLREATVSHFDLPESMLNYVIRTRESMVIDDASASELLADDPYVRAGHPKSLLCLPIVKRTKLVGVLYLENSLTSGVFTSDRVSMQEFLAAQAAISLENTYLYSDLQRSEAFLAEGQRMSRTGSWRWNIATGEVIWSEEHCRILGYDPSTARRATFGSFLLRVHPDDRAELQQRLDAATSSGGWFAFDYRVLLPDGSTKYLHGAGRPIVEESGLVEEYVGTTIDVTERRQNEEALRDAQADLARATRLASMGELTTLIAHEVSQPLMATVTNADACLSWLTNTPPNLDEARQAAERVVRNGHRAGAIVKSIRALARKSEPEMAAFDLNEALAEILMMLGGELRRRNVSLDTELVDDLEPAKGDRIQLQQVVLNLVMNGIEAMSAVQDRPRILRVSSRPHGTDGILIAVADVGTGLDPEKADRIFDGFFTTKPEGMGMGLTISRSIVETHGGRLWALPNEPYGCLFQFTVPVATENARTDDAP